MNERPSVIDAVFQVTATLAPIRTRAALPASGCPGRMGRMVMR